MRKKKLSNATYKKNLKLITQHAPNVAGLLDQVPADNNISIHKSVLKYKFGEELIELPGSPTEAFEMHPSCKMLIILGIGSGKGTIDLIKQAHTQDAKVFIIEPDYAVFKNAMACFSFEKFFTAKASFLLLGMPINKVFSRLLELFNRMEHCEYLGTIQIVRSKSIEVRFSNYADECVKVVAQARFNTFDSFGFEADSWHGLQIVCENLAAVTKEAPVINLGKLAPGVPAFIISAGPSLTESIPKLKKIKDKGLIISTDGAYGTLLKAGIIPDLVLSLERGVLSKPLFDRAPDCEDTTLIRFPFVQKEVVENFKGRRMVTYRNYEYFRYFYPPKGRIQCGVSVAHFCFRIAQLMQCAPLVLIGQDLCYHPENFKSHAEGIPHGTEENTSEELIYEKGAIWIPGNTYEKVLTTRPWARFIHDFQMLLDEYRVEVVNTSRLGAIIPGIPYAKLDEVVDKMPDVKDIERYREKIRVASQEDSTPNTTEVMRARITNWIRFFEVVFAKRDYISELIDKKDITIEELSALESLHMKLRDTPMFTAFILNIIGGEHVKIRNQRNLYGQTIIEENKEAIRSLYGQWYMLIFRNVDRFLDLLKYTLGTMT